MAKKKDDDKKKALAAPQKVKSVLRKRLGKKRGSKGGASDTRYYPRHGDATDNKLRSLRNIIMQPPHMWGRDKAGKSTL